MKTSRIKGPVMFLDIDGVLDNLTYSEFLINAEKPRRDKYGELFDPKCVANLEKIIDATDAQIVISSSWKDSMSLTELRQMWKDRNLPGKIIGVTPSASQYRGEQIRDWLEQNKYSGEYAIIDDYGEFIFQKDQLPHLFTADFFYGLDEKTTQGVIEFYVIKNQMNKEAKHLILQG